MRAFKLKMGNGQPGNHLYNYRLIANLLSCNYGRNATGSTLLVLAFPFYCFYLVCENNWMRRIGGVKRVKRSRMKDLREEFGTTSCLVGKIVKSWMKFPEHMVRMKDEITERI